MVVSILSAVFLFFLSGCNANDSKVALYPFGGVGITIEYFDKEQKGYLLLEGGSEEHLAFLKDSMSVEILSFMDEITGLSIDELTGLSLWESRTIQVCRNLFSVTEPFVGDPLKSDGPLTIRHYILKFKAPSIYGESVEEIKAVSYSKNFRGATFTEVWYNGKKIPIMTHAEVEALYPPKSSNDREAYERVMKESYYSGNLVAVVTESDIHIVLPIEKQ